MNGAAAPSLGKGVMLRRDRDGTPMLLVPEGALMLNPTAAAALELVDGRRTLDEIVAGVVERFDVPPEVAREEIGELLRRLTERGFVR